MQRWKNSLLSIAIALNCLLLFLLIFESRLSVPPWLQVAGRMHPLLLHFPLTLIILYAIASLFRPRASNTGEVAYNQFTNIIDSVLLLAALTAALTALMGLFLSREQGYDPETLQWHKWSGVAVSLFALGWYYIRNIMHQRRMVSALCSIFAIILIVFTGHQGAGITHGQNFLLAPMLPEKKTKLVPIEDAFVYADMVRPILEAKCMTCHNNNKAKGELIMETEEQLRKGGKTGLLWDSAAPDLGLLLRRVHLPLEEKKHMPPQGKTQLSEQDLAIISQWIRKGSNFKLRVLDLPEKDSLLRIAYTIFNAAETASYDFEAADKSQIDKLNSVNRFVTEENLQSPALTVSFFNSQLFQPIQLKELSVIKKQIVSLDLAKMPVTDEDLKTIAEFENLRKLNLSFSAITGATLPELKKLKFLRALSLSGTKVSLAQLNDLQSFPSLKTVYAWNTGASTADIDGLKAKNKQLHYESGFHGDTMIMKLSPPVLQNEELIITHATTLKLKHYINGTTIRYTLDGTMPDSLNSPIYKGDEQINASAFIKAKAFKLGWESSDVLEVNIYKNTFTADTLLFLTEPNPAYHGNTKMLIDMIKGEANTKNGSWVAWRERKMEVLLVYPSAITVSNVTLSTIVDIGGYIMPPTSIEVWGGDDPKQLRLLGKITPKPPTKIEPSSMMGFECKFQPSTVKYIKLVASPVAKLPSWHPGKGDKGWLFVDEILVN